jgi:hypothetical protein
LAQLLAKGDRHAAVIPAEVESPMVRLPKIE